MIKRLLKRLLHWLVDRIFAKPELPEPKRKVHPNSKRRGSPKRR